MGANPSPTSDVEEVAIEDASSLTAAVWQTLEAESNALSLPGLKTQPLDAFLRAAESQKLPVEEKRAILDQALLLFQNLYPHLPFKKERYNFAHPVETLTEIQEQLETLSELDFHSSVIIAFGFVVDAHTWYGLPAPYKDAVAFLPFQLRMWRDKLLLPHYVVTGVMNASLTSEDQRGGLGHPFFGPGAEIVRWNLNGTEAYLENQARGRLPGGNPTARMSREAVFATTVSLTYCQPPVDAQATLHYIPRGGGPLRGIRFPWGVATNMSGHTGFPHAAYSVNVPTAAISSATRVFVRQHGLLVAIPAQVDLERRSAIPEAFEFQYTNGTALPGSLDPAVLRAPSKPGARFGYLRIRQFHADGPLAATDDLLGEFRRILRDVMNPNAPDGLILDLRGNPGGDVQAAERMLQMLTVAHIHPVLFHLANTPAIRKVLEKLRSENRNRDALAPAQQVQLTDAQVELQPWIDDAEDSGSSGDPLTAGHPLTSEAQANETGQVYRGPCVLLIDGLTYSAADIFAAGFQDHGIGLIVGVDPRTGGGGANVWSHDELLDRIPPLPELPLHPLPPFTPPGDAPDPRATMSLAFRRCVRVTGPAVGHAIEDAGVEANLWAPPGSAEDLLAGFPAIVTLACEQMVAPQDLAIKIRNAAFGEAAVDVEVQTTGLDFLTFDLDGFTAFSSTVEAGVSHSFSVPVLANNPHPSHLTVNGSFSYPGASGTNLAWAAVRSVSRPE